MKWRQVRWWLLGACAYALFLVVNLPVSYAESWLAKRLPTLQLSDLSGTLLSGHASQAQFQNQPLGAVSWRFDWLAPFTASYGYRFELQGERQLLQGRVDARFGTIYLRDLSGRVPVAALDRWLPLPPHSIDGLLDIDVRRVVIKDGRLTAAEGDVSLRDANLSWPNAFPLGSYRMTLAPAGTGVAGQVTDVTSPLKLQCDFTLSPEGRYHLKGWLAARDPGDPIAQKFLAFLGSPDTSGHYPFDYNGQW